MASEKPVDKDTRQSHVTRAEAQLRYICSTVGWELPSRCFMVGVRVDGTAAEPPLWVVPHGWPYLAEHFTGLTQIQKDHSVFVPGEAATHPGRNEALSYRRQAIKALRRKLLEAVRIQPDAATWVTQASTFCRFGDYFASLVIQTPRASHVRWPLLQCHPDYLQGGPASLPEALVHHVLADAVEELVKPEWDQLRTVHEREPSEYLRDAGRELLSGVSTAGGGCWRAEWLFEAYTTISSLRNEGRESSGSFLVAVQGYAGVAEEVKLLEPVDLQDYRAARKLLDLCGHDRSLICDGASIRGLGRAVGSRSYTANLFQVRFVRQHVWELLSGGVVVMRVEFGVPTLPRTPLDEDQVRDTLARTFGSPPALCERLLSVVRTAVCAHHGTMLVVSRDAAAEAERLARQATRIVPTPLTPELMGLLGSVDGAVLIDPTGTCHAVGVILDGLASPRGKPGRGSRYNSAVRYVDWKQGSVAVVVSEDGMVDVLPLLRPRIRRDATSEMLGKLRNLAAATEPTHYDYHELLDWFVKNKFYLSATECDEANTLLKQVSERLWRFGMVRGHCDPFVSDPDMNETYFF